MEKLLSPFDAAKQIDISSGISMITGSYVDDSGKNICCPLPDHDDGTPSFTVYPKTQSWYCHGCHRGGSIVDFCMHYFGIKDSKEAAMKACDIMRISYKKDTVVNKSYDNYTAVISQVFDMIQYQQTNNPVEGELDFFYKRGLGSLIDSEGLLYCRPNYFRTDGSIFNWKSYLEKKFPDIDPAILDSYGLYNKYGELVFADRYLFPIRDKFGNIIGFSGRSLDKDKAKYYNSKESQHFKKNSILYNYHKAKHYDKIYVVEGYCDALSLIAVGIENVVAIMGSAFTEQQRALLKDKEVILSLDNDKVGRDSMYGLCLEYNYKVLNPSQTFKYKDFNEALCDGFDLNKYLQHNKPISAPEFAFVWLKDYLDLSDLDNRMIMFDMLSKICKRYNPVMRDYIATKFQRLIKGKRATERKDD